MTAATDERFAIIIPARYASHRFPGKPLAMLRGASGIAKSLIRRSWERACTVQAPNLVWVATDDQRIADEVMSFGGNVVMTSPLCRNGTERCAEAVDHLDLPDIILNLQGDAPLTPGHIISGLVQAIADDADAMMATAATRCSPTVLAHLMADQAAGRVGGTTVTFNGRGRALYFSKRILPYIPPISDAPAVASVHLHLGVYAYRKPGLAAYMGQAPSPLELVEGLEQLRFLEFDHPVRIATFDPPDLDCIELNNPSDIAQIEAILKAGNIV